MLSTEEIALNYLMLAIGSMVALIDFGFAPQFGRNITYVFSGAYGVMGYIDDAAYKADTMPAKPFCNDCDELPRLSLVCVFEVLHFLYYY